MRSSWRACRVQAGQKAPATRGSARATADFRTQPAGAEFAAAGSAAGAVISAPGARLLPHARDGSVRVDLARRGVANAAIACGQEGRAQMAPHSATGTRNQQDPKIESGLPGIFVWVSSPSSLQTLRVTVAGRPGPYLAAANCGSRPPPHLKDHRDGRHRAHLGLETDRRVRSPRSAHMIRGRPGDAAPGPSQASSLETLTLAEVHFLYWNLGGKQIN